MDTLLFITSKIVTLRRYLNRNYKKEACEKGSLLKEHETRMILHDLLNVVSENLTINVVLPTAQKLFPVKSQCKDGLSDIKDDTKSLLSVLLFFHGACAV